MTIRPINWRSERGSYSLETAVLVPVIIAVLGLLIALGRVSTAGGAVQSAAREAARAASLDRDPAAARRDADQAAREDLDDGGVPCTGITVSLDTSAFSLPLGQTGTVSATVSCTARLSNIGLPGLPGATTLHADFRSPVDAYRTRG